jgi:predicted Zn-dependent peptidase
MKPKFYRKILKNGMTLVFEKREVPVVSVAIAVRCGGINEDLNEKGISHYIEHMLYKGTPTRNAKKIAEEIERNGGVLNGFTDENITAYWCKMPSKHLKIALEVLSDMVKNPLFEQKELDKERKVIFEEIKMRRDNPRIYVLDSIKSFLYEEPFSSNLIGTEKTMNSITREKILQRFKEVYTPGNMVLCVVGNADFKEIERFAEKTFKKTNGGVKNFEIKTRNHSEVESRKGLDQANFVFAYHAPLTNEMDNSAAEVLNAILAHGMSSRLFHEIREKRNLAYSVSGDSQMTKDFAYSLIYVGTSKENIEKVKELILKEFEKVSKELDEKELSEVKEQLIGNHHISMEDSTNQMVSLLGYEMNGNAKEFYEYEKRIKGVKISDVKRLSRLGSYSFFALVPE